MIVGGGSYLGLQWFVAQSRSPLEDAAVALARGDHARALALAEGVLQRQPSSTEALLVAGYAAAGEHRAEVAIGYLQAVAEDDPGAAVEAIKSLGISAFETGWATPAELYFRSALRHDPSDLQTRARLILLLAFENRIWEAQQYILPLFQTGNFQINHLIVASSSDIWLADASQFAEKCIAVAPQDPLPLLHEADSLWRENQVEPAEALYRRIVAAHPQNVEAQARLGRSLAERATPEAFRQWHAQLPAGADEHPLIWFSRGLWAQRHDQPQAAARCFWEAVSRNPSFTDANYQLSQTLVAMGADEQAKPFAQRSSDLGKLRPVIDAIRTKKDPDSLRLAVEMLESLGRRWEARGWCQLSQTLTPTPEWVAPALARLRALPAGASYTVDSHNPARQVDLSTYPLPDWKRGQGEDAIAPPGGPSDAASPAGRITFTDSAPAAGLDFTYFNGAVSERFESMFEFDGGGVAVLDYDNDGWPDLYFTQGGPLPSLPSQLAAQPVAEHLYTDRLFRNLGDGRFADVTEAAGLGDQGYGQGVTVGDFDNDGLADLYVANVGENHLYRNNGDATFSDVTGLSGTAGDQWTSSCVLADFNGDTWPDLYVVNYLGGERLYLPCEKHGPTRCAPLDYAAEQDRLYRNLGDGRFEDVTETSGIVAPDGRGLGVIAADLDDSGRLSLFVANDMAANFLFSNQTAAAGEMPSFAERGVLSGLAFDPRGDAQACMGIAAEDADGNGLLDLFVTNYYGESNNLFMQQPGGVFQDEARAANLRDPGFQMLGWGTQFLDADLDGHPDLIVTNGHVHDPLSPEIPHRMPPQFFRNQGEGRFAELPAESLGEYFQDEYLGRALARLDWNRDGLVDFCVTHLDSPAALMTNQTAQHGHFLSVELVGVRSARDAVGATLRLTSGRRTQVRQLTAGDGFQASNERRIVFGLGAEESIERLEVRWPSGASQVYDALPVDSHQLLIEGAPAWK